MIEPLPELGVFALRRGRVLGVPGFAFDSAGFIICETTWYGAALRQAQLPQHFVRARRVRGTCLSLASEFATANFGHYLLDCLARIGIAERAGWALSSIDWFYLPRPLSPSAKRMLGELGIDEARCIWVDEAPNIVADTLLVTTFPGTKRNYAPVVPETLRKPFADRPRTGRRIYFPRRDERRPTNWQEVEGVMLEFGFDIFDFERSQREFEEFREADIVVAPHGSGLTHFAVCEPGTKILEIVPTDHVYPYWYSLAYAARHEYAYLGARSIEQRKPGSWGPSPFDYYVDPAELRSALSTLIAEPSASHSRNSDVGRALLGAAEPTCREAIAQALGPSHVTSPI